MSGMRSDADYETVCELASGMAVMDALRFMRAETGLSLVECRGFYIRDVAPRRAALASGDRA